MVVTLGDAGSGTAATDGRLAPRPLFPGVSSAENVNAFMYSLANDGQRLLVSSTGSSAQPPATVAVSWRTALESEGGGAAREGPSRQRRGSQIRTKNDD